jgi:hypothetical protein
VLGPPLGTTRDNRLCFLVKGEGDDSMVWEPRGCSYYLCNAPTLGHQGITGCYDDQSNQMEIIAST